jgi:adenylate cyclase class IV
MPTNAEFKAELRDMTLARHIARSLAGLPIETLDQVDTYYRVASGRLKRREIRVAGASALGPGAGLWGADVPDAGPASPGAEPSSRVEYIQYVRSNDPGVRDSDFVLMDERAFRTRFGASDPDVWVTVRKRREVWSVRDVAVHLDDVEGLGRFLEFEALVRPNVRSADEARALVATLRDAFRPALGEPVSGSYSDLLADAAQVDDPFAPPRRPANPGPPGTTNPPPP